MTRLRTVQNIMEDVIARCKYYFLLVLRGNLLDSKKSQTADVISRLIEYWKNQGIEISAHTIQEIERIERENSLRLPDDFKGLYQRVNGMLNFYPNDMDKEGFLFYPIETILSAENESENCRLKNKDKIFIFAEYLHKSWIYGFEVKNDGTYVIGIIATPENFKPMADSLAEFIELYLEDSPKLYDWE